MSSVRCIVSAATLDLMRMPRDAGGSFEITEGTGPIKAMISTGEVLEIYKVDKTFRVTTPRNHRP